nr:adenine deaminase C-terminal domain-containing protein [Paenibacillus beijingensis]
MEPLYKHRRVLGLGEVMNAPAVLNGDAAMLSKLASAAALGKLIDGHAAGLDADAINAYMTAGIRTDHECTTAAEALERVQRGMYVMLREGSAARDLQKLIQAVNPQNARRFLFVTDDKHLDDLIREGSIDHNVRLAIRCGVDPVLAIQMATINAAECFRLERKGAIAPGYDADIVILDDLDTVAISGVYKAGKLIASNGTFIHEERSTAETPSSLMDTVHINTLFADNLSIRIHHDSAMANVIGIIPNSIHTDHLVEKVNLDERRYFQISTIKDQLKLVVAERHHATGNVGLGIVKGLGLASGAIASTVAHDSHNIVAAGTNDADLLLAINTIAAMKGGIVVVENGNILSSLPLPIGGLMSDRDYEAVYSGLDHLNDALRTIGFKGDYNPFLTLSFLALPVIPELKLTDLGLFHVKSFAHTAVDADV